MFKKGESTSKSDTRELEKDTPEADFTEETVASEEIKDGHEEVLEDVTDIPLEEQVLTLQAELNQSTEQAEDYYNRLQRLQAEFDNYRKRTQKEKEDTAKYASERVVEAMLPILDNFERAIDSSQVSQDFEAFSQGIEMIFKQMQNILAKEGLQPIETVGNPFDPNIHEAIMQVESEEYPENTVVEELQKGYYLKEKVLRPSMVKVSN